MFSDITLVDILLTLKIGILIYWQNGLLLGPTISVHHFNNTVYIPSKLTVPLGYGTNRTPMPFRALVVPAWK